MKIKNETMKRYLSEIVANLLMLFLISVVLITSTITNIMDKNRLIAENERLYERIHYLDIDVEACWDMVDKMELEDEAVIVEENEDRCCCINEDEQVECNHLGDPD